MAIEPINLKTLNIFHKNNILAHTLPEDKSGKTQQFDLRVFSPFSKKGKRPNKTGLSTLSMPINKIFFSFCYKLRGFFHAAFTDQMKSSLSTSGIYPFDPLQQIGSPRPRSVQEAYITMSMEEMDKTLKEKRMNFLREDRMNINGAIMKNGFFDTSKGLITTGEEAMKLVETEEQSSRKFKAVKIAEAEAERKLQLEITGTSKQK